MRHRLRVASNGDTRHCRDIHSDQSLRNSPTSDSNFGHESLPGGGGAENANHIALISMSCTAASRFVIRNSFSERSLAISRMLS